VPCCSVVVNFLLRHIASHSANMPLYEVVHIVSLTAAQKSELARAVTETHSQLFTTPSLFVNVVFTDAIKQDAYVGGKKVSRCC